MQRNETQTKFGNILMMDENASYSESSSGDLNMKKITQIFGKLYLILFFLCICIIPPDFVKFLIVDNKANDQDK